MLFFLLIYLKNNPLQKQLAANFQLLNPSHTYNTSTIIYHIKDCFRCHKLGFDDVVMELTYGIHI
jgi:hypothetical protein